MSARIQIAHRDDGYLLRIIGGNGEQVMGSELYADDRDAIDALRVVRAALRAAQFERVDERRPPAPPLNPAELAVAERFEQAADGLADE